MDESTVKTIDEYIRSQDPAVQPQLIKVRETIRAVLPDAEERISWGMPTWRRRHNIIHFAAAKKHIGIYPGPDAVEHFEEQLKERGMKYSKGAIQVPYSDDLPLDFIRDIAVWCRDFEEKE